jgi:menaquinone-specific isochorismate synthase
MQIGLATGHRRRPDRSELHAVTIPLSAGDADNFEGAVTGAVAETCTLLHSADSDRSGGTGLTKRGAIYRSSGRLLACLGAATTFEIAPWKENVSEVAAGLSAIPSDDPVGRPGSTPIAIGALPFDPRNPAELVVPEVTFVREPDGSAWVTLTGSGPLDLPDLERRPPTSTDPPAGTSADLVDNERGTFVDSVVAALREIAAGKIEKVVLARKVTAVFNRPVEVAAILDRLRTLESASTIFAISRPGHAFIGASPELIASRAGAEVTSIPLAGSVPMTGNRQSDEAAAAMMVASSKENFEHRLVVEAVEAELSRWCRPVEVRDEPEVLWLRQIAHLATVVTGTLEGDPGSWPTALELAAGLHPTPAVCGSPTEAAIELIGALEPGGRGLYAGLVGWVDSSGDGEFHLGIRSAELRREVATVHAGAGIVAGSDPQSELHETSVKLETMLAALTAG